MDPVAFAPIIPTTIPQLPPLFSGRWIEPPSTFSSVEVVCTVARTPSPTQVLWDLRGWFSSFTPPRNDFFGAKKEEEFFTVTREDIKVVFIEAKTTLNAWESEDLQGVFQALQESGIGDGSVDLEAVNCTDYQDIYEIFREVNSVMRGVEGNLKDVILSLQSEAPSREADLCGEVVKELLDSVYLRRGIISSGEAILRRYLGQEASREGDSMVVARSAESLVYSDMEEEVINTEA